MNSNFSRRKKGEDKDKFGYFCAMSYIRRWFNAASTLVILFFLPACGGADKQPHDNTPATTVPSSARSRIKYAHGLAIDYPGQYKEVRITSHAAGRTDTLDYLLLPAGMAVPPGHAHAQVIRIPVRSMIVMGSPHIAQAEFAGVADRITGVGNGDYVYCPLVREGLQTGRVRQVGLESGLNNELVISMRPGILMTMTNPDAAFGEYATLMDAGIPVLPNADWLETTPLGKAEWVKLMGALTNREDLVNMKFDSIEQAYLRLAAIGNAAAIKPSVIIGMPFKGTWYTPAGESYVAQLLRDAGASYYWSDTKGTGSLALNFETVAPEALKADFWLDAGDVNSKKDILSQDARYGAFRAFRSDAVYNYNRRVNDHGSSDYWESGAVNPQRVLADLIRILHPGTLPADTLMYYKQLK
ncbi:MAG TPA: ABC transporter substrate-binding protein [Puia sp.]|nr:ABC transporter substrate-binding protein [Puia sp.]